MRPNPAFTHTVSFFVIIVLLNLLIAIMSDSYEKVWCEEGVA